MNKKGIFLPLVLILLLVFAMIGLMFNTRAQTEFRQSYFTSDMLRAQLVADAALNEALAAIRADLNNNMRDSFINGGELDIDLELTDSLKDDMLEIEDDATTNNVKISELDIKAECVNINKFNSCGDIMGTLVIEVNVDLNSVKRDIKTSYDYKVVDIRPVGNEYTFMVNNAYQNTFNVPHHFFVDARNSKGISIGGNNIEINLHSVYSTIPEWGYERNLDIHKDGDSSKSLIPGGGKREKSKHSMSVSKAETNKPYENEQEGTMGEAKSVHAGETNFEHGPLMVNGMMPEPEGPQNGAYTKNYFDPGLFAFNSGFIGKKSYTHFFGKNCSTAKNVTILGDVKKIYTMWGYSYKNNEHGEKEKCPKYMAELATCISTCGSSSDPPEECEAHKNSDDWTADDQWRVGIVQNKVSKYYSTSESKFKQNAIKIDNKINFKENNFNNYKKIATRYVKEFPGNVRDTFIPNSSSNKLFLEGVVVCDIAILKGISKLQTPGLILARDRIDVIGNISPDDKIQCDDSFFSDDFFVQENFLSLVSFNDIRNDSGKKEGIGFYAKNKFVSSRMNIIGNLTIDDLRSKNFGGLKSDNIHLKFYEKFLKKDILVDEKKYSKTVSLSPIPSSYIVMNNN